jgi:glucan phosphoethanolaminetransferase (alkaline phosphatase superfamily)
MIAFLSIVLFIIFLILGLLHFYWFFGGKWGLQQVVPTKKDGTHSISPPKFATFIVALVLISFGIIYLAKTNFIAVQLPKMIVDYTYWLVPSLFIIRAIGDFNYVGFFKKVKHTTFAKADSKWFTPLCVCIGSIGIAIQLIS